MKVILKDGETIMAVKPYNIEWENSCCELPNVHIYGALLSDAEFHKSGSIKKAKCGPEVKRVIYNEPATVVLWADGTKTVVRCRPGDVFDRRIGFLTALAKKIYGGSGRFNDVIRKATEEG